MNNGWTPIEEVKTTELRFDADYQRALGALHLKTMEANFDPRGLGIIAVSERPDGHLYVIDGHHRCVICKKCGVADMRAEVFRGLSLEDEAGLFLLRNFFRAVTPAAKYKARIIVKEPQALAIKAAVEKAGFILDPSRQAGGEVIAGVSKLDSIYESYGTDAIVSILNIIRTAWPIDKHSRESSMIGGLAAFMHMYPGVKPAELARKLEKPDSQEVLSKRRTYMRELATSGDTACARSIWIHYNKNRQSKRLPNYFDS
jgi:hypothetical protein